MNSTFLQQEFLDLIKQFRLSNPNKTIDNNFVYSILIGFHTPNFCENISVEFPKFINRYKNTNMEVMDKHFDGNFLVFFQGTPTFNEIKLYIPLDRNHITSGGYKIFDFLSQNNIQHESKIAKIIRNDNLVIRVNSFKDIEAIVNYIESNPDLKQGMMRVNPFLPNYNGIGMVMDNKYSYNSIVSKWISEFLKYLESINRLDLFTVNNLNKYINNNLQNIADPDLKDICSLICKVTNPNFKIQDFIKHASYKLLDKYDENAQKIADPKYYFEDAVKMTNKVHPQNTKEAISQYLKGNANYFTNRNRVREALIKYVNPRDVITIMRLKLAENGIVKSMNEDRLIDEYVKLVLTKDLLDCFEFIKIAYVSTITKYGRNQADIALSLLIKNKDIRCFTNEFKCRTNLEKYVLDKDILQIILSGIDIKNLDVNNIDEIVNRFYHATFQNSKSDNKTIV